VKQFYGYSKWTLERRYFQILHGNGMVKGMSNFSLDFDFCEHCVYGKQNQLSFSSNAKREEGILERLHSVVFGPVLGKSI